VGQLPKVYLRIDPNIDQHPDPEGMLLLICAANRQPHRGRFVDVAIIERCLGRERAKRFLSPRRPGKTPDVVQLEDRTFYVDGWDEWQEGDLTVGDRVRRLRARRRDATVTPPLQDRSPPPRHQASGVRRKANDKHHGNQSGVTDDAGLGQPFEAAVLKLFCELTGRRRPGGADRRAAGLLSERGYSLETVRAGMLQSIVRREARDPDKRVVPLSPISSLAYFLPAIEEAAKSPPEPGYADYLAQKVQDLRRAAEQGGRA
jgi:hypothetical protein